jgi:hypothetical protein
MLLAVDQVPGTVVPSGVPIVAVPSALNVIVFTTPLVWTWTLWPTISDPGVHAAWAATPAMGVATAALKNTALNSTDLVIARLLPPLLD